MADLVARIKTNLVSPILDSPSSPVRLLYDRLSSSSHKDGDHAASPAYSLVNQGPAEESSDESAAFFESGAVNGQTKLDIKPTTYRHEFRVYAGYMIPLFCQQCIQRYSAVMGPVSAMGKYGSVALAGASLGNTTLNILGIAPTLGITSALDTLSTQAHGGSKLGDVRDLNLLYSLRVFLVTTISMAFLIPLMCNFHGLFRLLGVEPDAADAAARYMALGAIGMPGWYAYECLRKYAQARGMMTGPALAGVVAGPVSYFVLHSDWFGSDTPPLALAVYFTVCFLAEVVWAIYALPKETWQNLPPFRLVCQDLGVVFRLGLAGLISVCSDWFAWEYLSFASAWLGTQTLAANSVFLASATFLFCLPGSIMNAASTRVGNHLGRNAPNNAKIGALSAMYIGTGVAILVGTVLVINRTHWISIFTDDPEIFDIANRVMPFFCIIIALDAMQGTIGGVMRGAGLPEDIARSMLIGHWLIGIPLSAVFAFTPLRLGLFGLWGGFGIGLTIVCVKLTWQLIKNDWELSARKAQSHIQHTAEVVAQPLSLEDQV